MGKDRRKKGGNRKQVDSSVPVDVGSESKAQQGPRNRESQEQSQKDDGKNVGSLPRDKISDHPPSQSESKPDSPNRAELFANLKRETDDIKAFKYQKPRRQITSNWARYEERLPGPDREVELQGADFEALMNVPHSGHFQFKYERSWDADVTPVFGELFSLDVDLLADGLATIPLYQKLDLPVSLFSAAELEDIDYYAKQCAVKYETTKSMSLRNRGRKETVAYNLLNPLLTKKGSPVPPEEDTASKETSAALSYDITQPEAQIDDLYTESVTDDATINNDSNTGTDTRRIPETGSIPDFNKVIPTQETRFSKTSVSSVPQNVADAERQLYSIPTEEFNHEPKSLSKDTAAVVTPGTEVYHSTGAVMAEAREQVTQQSNFEQTEHFPKSVGPLDQRPSRHKRSQAQASEVQEVDSQKSHQTEDLDFFLSLKNPVKEVQISSLRPSRVTKPTIEDGKLRAPSQASEVQEVDSQKSQQTEDLDFFLSLKKPVKEVQISSLRPSRVTKPTIEDDDAVAPNSSQFPLVMPQKDNEDLEDWLDSVLD